MTPLHVLAVILAFGVSLAHASWSIEANCNAAQQELLKEELESAREMALNAASDFSMTEEELQLRFYNDFIAKADRDGLANRHAMFQIYSNIAMMLNSDNPHTEYAFTISCENRPPCARWGKFPVNQGIMAYMDDSTKNLNICDSFFYYHPIGQEAGAISTLNATGYCRNPKSTLTLRDARMARSSILLHQFTHTNYVMGSLGAAKIYASGFRDNWDLPRGRFNRSCSKVEMGEQIECPDSNNSTIEGLCPPGKAVYNGDTYTFIAAGSYFLRACPSLPYPDLGSNTKRSRISRFLLKREYECPHSRYDGNGWANGWN